MPSEKQSPSPSTRIDLRVPGFKASGIACGIKKNGRKDLALIVSEAPAAVAALFTTSKVKAAPVVLDMERIKKGASHGIIVNSGNANACTGKRGRINALKMTALAEEALGVPKGSIMVSSTGVIGVPLPIEKVASGIDELVNGLSEDGLESAAEAIMTTDAFPKTASSEIRIKGKTVRISGLSKGAGMICPNMATMLAFFVTDANMKAPALKKALKEAADNSFNSIIVDNDTSTNDTVMVFANGAGSAPEIKPGTVEFKAFTGLLTKVSTELAHMIVRDGEGATRFIEIEVAGAATGKEARLSARTVAESYLVKTAFFGGDPNWGRILAALGRSGAIFKENKVSILFNGVQVVKDGLDTGKETEAANAIKAKEVKVRISLGAGRATARVWTTDLSYEYVKINSAYRT